MLKVELCLPPPRCGCPGILWTGTYSFQCTIGQLLVSLHPCALHVHYGQYCHSTNTITSASTPHSLPVPSVTMVIDHTSTSSLLPCQHVALSAYRDATSRANQSSKARSEAQLKHVALGDEDIFQLFWRRFSHVCLKVPAADNFYLSWYMRGAGYCNLAQRQDFYPPYLREESFQRLKVSVCSLTASVVRLSALFKEQ